MNLTQVSIWFKKGVKILLGVAAVYYLLILVIGPAGRSIIKSMFFRPDPPTVLYGMLDPLEFIEKPITNQTPTYVLNTKNGKLPYDLPEVLTVYQFKPNQFSYQAGKNALKEAYILGFPEEDLITDLKGSIYKWRSLTSRGTLEINIDSRELILNTNLLGKTKQFPEGTLDENQARRYAREVFNLIGRFDDELYKNGTQKVHLGRYVGNQIIKTNESRNAQIARVDLFRSINNFPILGPDPDKGLLHVYLRNPTDERDPYNYPVVEAYYWKINTTSNATYPLISVKDAWAAVQQGKGVITSVIPKNANPFDTYESTSVENILIDNIYIAYYDTPKLQKYLQPIYVFSGKYTTRGTSGGEITIYLPAVSGEFTKSVSQSQE